MIERTKYIPPIISLAGGLVASIASIINRYSSLETMVVVLIALIVFYIIGSIIRYFANKILYIPKLEAESELENSENSGDDEGENDYNQGTVNETTKE